MSGGPHRPAAGWPGPGSGRPGPTRRGRAAAEQPDPASSTGQEHLTVPTQSVVGPRDASVLTMAREH